MQPTLCSRPFWAHGLVFPAAVDQSPRGAAADACVSGPACHHTRGVDGPESDVHDCRDGVRVVAPVSERPTELPVTVILDNARDQRCVLVQTVAQTLGMELRY
jgi:hypothetical protein